jgi:hypothetical protein
MITTFPVCPTTYLNPSVGLYVRRRGFSKRPRAVRATTGSPRGVGAVVAAAAVVAMPATDVEDAPAATEVLPAGTVAACESPTEDAVVPALLVVTFDELSEHPTISATSEVTRQHASRDIVFVNFIADRSLPSPPVPR